MGKDLKGKELGVGISQRKDGLYTARITDSYGKRVQKYFPKLQECRKWIADMQFQKEHGTINAGSDMTVDAWFEYWMENVKGKNIRSTTERAIKERYKNAVKEIIGNMTISEVRPIHCQQVLNCMSYKNRNGTIGKTRAVMHSLFECAAENNLIEKNPVSKSVKVRSEIDDKNVHVLTLPEQRIFESCLGDGTMDLIFRLALQTGMRAGEICGMKWSDIDFNGSVINVRRTLTRVKEKGFVEHEPKTKNGYRVVPMTEEAKSILKIRKNATLKQKCLSLQCYDYVFLTRNGNPMWRTNLNTRLANICEKNGLPHISMHCLRHTFATRCIESGMNPKILQKILGHSSIKMTMDLYVHATEESKIKEMKAVESSLKVV